MRKITFAKAINEALHQILESVPEAFLIGQGVISPWYVGLTTEGLIERYGPLRIIDTPVSEGGVTGAAVGAALAGMRPIVEHPRMDFMYLAMDQICNHAANWHSMFGGRASVPMTIWGIINRRGEQAAQHSQALHAMYAHVPGLKVVMPSTPYDAKGLLYAAVMDGNPVLFIDDRMLYAIEGDVPEGLYKVPIGKAEIRRQGRDVSILATSMMVHEALAAAEELAGSGVDAEVIDLRSLRPLDEDAILKSVKKTGRAVIADGGWKGFGAAQALAGLLAEKAFYDLKSPVGIVALPDSPAPASVALEKDYYPASSDIANIARSLMKTR